MWLKQKTNKLFYGKWLYKVTCRMIGSHLIRNYKVALLENVDYLDSLKIRSPGVNIPELKNFIIKSLYYLKNDNIKKVIDFGNVRFYVETKDQFKQIIKDLKKYVVSTTEPEDKNDINILLTNKKYILCNNLPHGKFKYKITFKELPYNIKNNLITWAEKYSSDELRIPKRTKNHFKSVKYHYGAHYFYVKDSKMIMLISMVAGDYVSRTDEFILRSSINTVS